ncbi:MAG: KH domain-containing protein [bacterium]|nr:KH domain-containing protein [bacterium]
MKIEKYLEKLLDLLLMENYEIIVEDSPETMTLKIALAEQDSGILIGHHGDTISALQRLLRTVYNDELGEKRLIVNINDYRDAREEKIYAMIEKGVAKILQYGGDYRLYRLNSGERFFVHKTISEDPKLSNFTSFSQDEEDGRVLVIAIKDE